MNTIANFPAVAGRAHHHQFRLRVPVMLLWLLLLPLVPLLWLALVIACAVFGVNPFQATAALFRILASLKGILLDIQTDNGSVQFDLF